MWIDSHCHLNNDKLADYGGAEGCIKTANENKVIGMLTINSLIREEFPEILEIARRNKNVWCTVGTHPHEASQDAEKSVTLQELVDLSLSDPNIVGYGESGLDYFYNHSTPEDQQASFRKHIQASLQTDMPLVVHARDADDDIIRLIREETGGKGMRGVMHCFSAGPKMAEEALELGYYISFSGILTFKTAENLRQIARSVPRDRLLVETDSPYLAPEPYRGKKNQPAWVARTGSVLGDVLGITDAEIAKITSDNFFRLFNKAKLV